MILDAGDHSGPKSAQSVFPLLTVSEEAWRRGSLGNGSPLRACPHARPAPAHRLSFVSLAVEGLSLRACTVSFVIKLGEPSL